MCDTTYNTPMNTIGIGDPVPFGCNNLGSGDKFGNNIFNSKNKKVKITTKKPAQNMFIDFTPRPLIVMSNKK